MIFGEITSEGGVSFLAAHFDGILGMAWTAISVNGIKPWFPSLCDNGAVSNCEFSFYASKGTTDGSSLVLGGTLSKYYSGFFSYHDLLSETYWPVNLVSITTDG